MYCRLKIYYEGLKQRLFNFYGALLSISCQVSAKLGTCTVIGLNEPHLLKVKCLHSPSSVSILSSTSVPLRPTTTVQLQNLALVETKRITLWLRFSKVFENAMHFGVIGQTFPIILFSKCYYRYFKGTVS